MPIGSPEISEVFIVNPLWRYLNAGNLKPRRGLYSFCTNRRIIFLVSASLKLPFEVNIALVQTRYHGDRKPRNFGNLHSRPRWRHMNAGNLKPRRGLYSICTNPTIIFLSAASLRLPFDIIIVLVQTRYHGDRKPRIFGNLHSRPYISTHECG